MGQIDITDFVTEIADSVATDKMTSKADKTYVDNNFVLVTTLENELNTKADTEHTHDDRYYTESEVDTKLGDIESALDDLVGFSISIVQELPQSGESGVIYLVDSGSGIARDLYNEYIWTGTDYEKLGSSSTDIDLSGYATLTYVNTKLLDYVTSSVLATELSIKSDITHNHDSRYYTENEIDTKLTDLEESLLEEFDVNFVNELNTIFEQMLLEE